MVDPNATLAQQMGLIHKPSLRERFARWLGFHYPHFPDMDDLDRDTAYTAGAVAINIHLKLTLRDRWLVLLGGNLAVRNYVKTDVPVKLATTRGTWSVVEGGAEFP